MATKTLKLSTVVLKFPDVIAVFIVYAKAIYTAMIGNPLFAALATKVTNLSVDITALYDAETGFKTTPPTKTIQQRDKALEKVKADLRSLRNDVQAIADADPTNAEAIIAGAGMAAKDQAVHGKQKNSAKYGVDPGSVVLTAEGAGAHEWRVSTDEKEWTQLSPTLKAKATVKDLKAGITYYFQNRKMLRNDERTEWSQSVRIMAR